MRVLTHRRPLRLAARRRGLAPLELVLWLPVLMLLAALIVNYGTSAAWRVRGEVVSRDAVWRIRWPRTGATEARPDVKVWPADAQMRVEADAPLMRLDDPSIAHPVVRGPIPNGFRVQPTLDPDDRGAVRGVADISRTFPMLPRLGKYKSGEVLNPLLDEKWSVAEMGIYTNETRRIKSLYVLPRTPDGLPQAFQNAVQALLDMPNYADLRVLDNDDEIRLYQGRRADFHPTFRANIYGIDPQDVRKRKVEPLVVHLDSRGRVQLGAISRLPRSMAQYFLSMFRQAQDNGVLGLDTKIQQLEDYLGRMVEIEDQLKQSFLQQMGS